MVLWFVFWDGCFFRWDILLFGVGGSIILKFIFCVRMEKYKVGWLFVGWFMLDILLFCVVLYFFKFFCSLINIFCRCNRKMNWKWFNWILIYCGMWIRKFILVFDFKFSFWFVCFFVFDRLFRVFLGIGVFLGNGGVFFKGIFGKFGLLWVNVLYVGGGFFIIGVGLCGVCLGL